jgi:hypothetical protein
MKQHEQRRIDALRRAKDFLDANTGVIGALAGSAGKRQLDDAVAQLATLGNTQGAANLQIAGHLSRQKALVLALKTQHMQPIAIYARARLRGVPDYAALTRSAPHLHLKQLVRAARAMATAAAPHIDELVSGGFTPDAVTRLATAADAVEQAQLDRANTKVRRIGATKGIEAELVAGREALAMLHAVIRSQLADNPTFLAAWDAARRVTLKLGPARTPAITGVAPGVATPPLRTAA